MDTFDTGVQQGANALPPLSKTIFLAFPKIAGGGTAGPVASDKALRAILDAIANLEQR